MTPALQTQPYHERLKKTHAAQRWRYGNKQKIAKSRREKYLNEKNAPVHTSKYETQSYTNVHDQSRTMSLPLKRGFSHLPLGGRLPNF